MSKENPLSHHEQLRYDYLFKNIHYLNDRERREFDYLQQKMAGPKSEVHPSYQEEKEEPLTGCFYFVSCPFLSHFTLLCT